DGQQSTILLRDQVFVLECNTRLRVIEASNADASPGKARHRTALDVGNLAAEQDAPTGHADDSRQDVRALGASGAHCGAEPSRERQGVWDRKLLQLAATHHGTGRASATAVSHRPGAR